MTNQKTFLEGSRNWKLSEKYQNLVKKHIQVESTCCQLGNLPILRFK